MRLFCFRQLVSIPQRSTQAKPESLNLWRSSEISSVRRFTTEKRMKKSSEKREIKNPSQPVRVERTFVIPVPICKHLRFQLVLQAESLTQTERQKLKQREGKKKNTSHNQSKHWERRKCGAVPFDLILLQPPALPSALSSDVRRI